MWYDHVEEQQQEFKEIKEIYETIQKSRLDDKEHETAERRKDLCIKKLQKTDLSDKLVLKDIERILEYAYV